MKSNSYDIFSILKKSELFKELKDNSIHILSDHSSLIEKNRKEHLFFFNDKADSLWLTLKGRVKVYRLNPLGKEQVLHLLGEGSMPGEAALFFGGKYPASAVTTTNALFLKIPRSTFLNAGKNDPEILMKMIGILAKRLVNFVHLIDDLSLKEVAGRLSRYIDAKSTDKSFFELPCSKVDLAALIGTVPETLSRNLKQLEDEKIIRVAGKTIHILNKDALKAKHES